MWIGMKGIAPLVRPCQRTKTRGTAYCTFLARIRERIFKKSLEGKLGQKDDAFRGTVFPEGTSDFSRFEFDADSEFLGATFIGEANSSRAVNTLEFACP